MNRGGMLIQLKRALLYNIHFLSEDVVGLE